MSEMILQVNNLETSFYTHVGEVRAVRDVSFSVKKGEILGIVGESGSGKSTVLLSIMGLLQHPGKVKSGEIIFEGENLTKKSNREMQHIRGRKISMIFQDPMSSLNPVFTVGNQIAETIMTHEHVSRKDANKRVLELLELVRIPSAKSRTNGQASHSDVRQYDYSKTYCMGHPAPEWIECTHEGGDGEEEGEDCSCDEENERLRGQWMAEQELCAATCDFHVQNDNEDDHGQNPEAMQAMLGKQCGYESMGF